MYATLLTVWLALVGPAPGKAPRRRPAFGRPLLETLEDRTVPSGGPVGNLVIFGDSLSDAGNAALATGGALPSPALYYQGRFSNGPTWVDTLAKYLGEPAVRPSLAGGLDYAFGGATVAYQDQPSPFNTFPRVSQQVGQYLVGHVPAANDLMVVWGGANDFIESFASPTGPISPTLSADTLASSLVTLANAGARQFVVPNLPPLGETPFIRGLGAPGLSAAADHWTAAFDAELGADVASFKSSHPGATVVSVDVAGLFQQVTQPGNPFGFVNTTDAVGPLVPGSPFLAAVTATGAQDYLFYDGVHPTSKAHQLVGVEAAAGVYDALGAHHLVVTSTADTVDPTASGLSLREMVNLSNAMLGRQTITFDLGPGPHQITLSGKGLPIRQALTVLGPGAEKLTISGNATSRAFDVGSGVTATLAGLTIANGLADHGGGIDNLGALTVADCAFTRNVATEAPGAQGAQGGAIDNEASGSLTVKNSTFTGNRSLGTITIGFGGAIENTGALAVSDCTFSHNLAWGVGGNPVGFNGGVGGAIDDQNGPVRIAGTTFLDNTAQGGGNQGALAFGGALNYFGPTPSVPTVVDCTFVGNVAVGAPGGDGVSTWGFGEGGGICSSYSDLTVTGSAFTDNQALGGPMAPGAPSSDTAASYAGGIGFFVGTLTLADSALTGNEVISGAGGNGGPGIASEGGALGVGFSATATITNTTIRANAAIGGAGGKGAAGGDGVGGGIDVSVASTATFTNCTIADNRAVGGAGGAGANGGNGIGGGLEVGLGALFGAPDASAVTLNGCTLARNLAQGGEGGGGGNGGNGLGGGVAALAGITTISNSTVDHNAAIGGAGADGGNGIGGGVYVAVLTVSDGTSTFTEAARVDVTASTIGHNRADGGEGEDGSDGLGEGGGVYALGTFTAEAATVSHNRASTSGDNLFP